MKFRDTFELLLLGAIWGASFLFMRVAAPEFGPVPLIAIRVAIAAACLSLILASQGKWAVLRGSWRKLSFLGTINSALPFSLFAFATLSLTAGFAAVLNATAPLFGALVAFVWLRERPRPKQVLGLWIGFVGVVLLVWHKLSVQGDLTAIFAALLAATGYGIASHFAKRQLPGLEPLAVATGSLVAASAVLAVPAVWLWPAHIPSLKSWGCVLALGLFCTALAYAMYFRLIVRVGPTKAILVTYLIPVFGILWGRLFLSEQITLRTLLGGTVILIGTTIVARSGGSTVSSPAPASQTQIPSLPLPRPKP